VLARALGTALQQWARVRGRAQVKVSHWAWDWPHPLCPTHHLHNPPAPRCRMQLSCAVKNLFALNCSWSIFPKKHTRLNVSIPMLIHKRAPARYKKAEVFVGSPRRTPVRRYITANILTKRSAIEPARSRRSAKIKPVLSGSEQFVLFDTPQRAMRSFQFCFGVSPWVRNIRSVGGVGLFC
jgi:hypothetical protein